MYKLSTFLAESDYGPTVVPLFGPADAAFEKVASVGLLPEVLVYISNLKPNPQSHYVLVNALGAGEYYGPNINSDHFEEEGLIHKPDGWTNNPLVDKALAKDWPYGFPTFYQAGVFSHHRNKLRDRAYGDVELSVWNDHMKRVELVVRVDHEKCVAFGGIGVWDKLSTGQHPDCSMGSKVPYDLSSITTDWPLYRKALATFNPRKHKSPGAAVVEFHKQLKAKDGRGIRGLSITRNDYDEWTKNHMNRILPDGRKVFVYNPYPRFFDISFVFIGADRTAKVMVFIYQGSALSSAEAAERAGYQDPASELHNVKTASAVEETHEVEPIRFESFSDEVLKTAFLGKGAGLKKGEIDKEVNPDWFGGKGVPLLARNEQDIPEWAIRALATVSEAKALGTTGSMGIVLRPREFQQITLIRMGKGDLSHELAAANKVFPKAEEIAPMSLGAEDFSPALARILMPLLQERSALGPILEQRIIILSDKGNKPATSHSAKELRKIGAAYNGYRQALMDMVATAQDLLPLASPSDVEVCKLATAPIESVFSPLSFSYLQEAFLDEFGDIGSAMVASSESAAGMERA